MGKGRLEAFSDGVIAIIITIMVLELHAPESASLGALGHVLPGLLSYVLSFIYVGIYWNNHHHLFQAVRRVSGGALWANLHLLFWMSLIPFATGWMGASHFGAGATAAYGIVLLLCALAWEIARRVLLGLHGADSALARAVRVGTKEWASLALYAAGIGLALVVPWGGVAVYALVAGLWLVPDRRIEREVARSRPEHE